MSKLRICRFWFLFISLFLQGQNFDKTDFYEADMAFMSGDYESAQLLYSRLLKSDPENANLNFLHGLCLINIQGRKKESLEYLRKAAPYANKDYEYGNPKETNAPIEVIKYYGMACKLNNDISNAMNLFNQYKSFLTEKENDEIEIINSMIESCLVAQSMQDNPVFYKHVPGVSYISGESKLYPVVSDDETLLFFSVKGKYDKDEIFFVKNVNGTWTNPEKITAQLGAKSECYPSSISADNQRLYLTVKIGLSTDIYCSEFTNNRWQKMEKLGKPINGKDWDSQAWESSDGRSLFFSSDRKGGFGNMDLYRSEKDDEGNWLKPVNLGEIINTKYNELMPVIRNENTRLYFKSEGHESMGGYDIFYSYNIGENEWTMPTNVGYPLNTTDDDIFFVPMNDMSYAYISQANQGNEGYYDIHRIEIFSEDNPRTFMISGLIALEGGEYNFNDTYIDVYNTSNYEKVFSIQPIAQSGEYIFTLKQGNYMMNVNNPECETFTQSIDLPIDAIEDGYRIDLLLKKPSQEVAQALDLTGTSTKSKKSESTIFPEAEAESEAGSQVEIIAYNPTSDVSVNDYSSSHKTNQYQYTIQILALLHEIELTAINEKYPVEIQKGDDKYYRYITGSFTGISEAEKVRKEIAVTIFKDAFIRYYNLNDYLNLHKKFSEDQTDISEDVLYTIQIMALKNYVDLSTLNGLTTIKVSYGNDGFYRYTIGEYKTLSQAQIDFSSILKMGYKGAFIREISKISNYTQ